MSKLKKKTLSYGLKMTYYGTFTQEIVKVTLKRLRVPQNAKFHIKRKKSYDCDTKCVIRLFVDCHLN